MWYYTTAAGQTGSNCFMDSSSHLLSVCLSWTVSPNSSSVSFRRLRTLLRRPLLSVWASTNGVFKLKEVELKGQIGQSTLSLNSFCFLKDKYVKKLLNIPFLWIYIYLNRECVECSCTEPSISTLASVNTQYLLFTGSSVNQLLKDPQKISPHSNHKRLAISILKTLLKGRNIEGPMWSLSVQSLYSACSNANC